MTDEVGKKSPPKDGRWRKGHSGNPRGRPKGRLNFNTELAAELSETIQITENGVTKRIPKLRGMLKAMTASAIKGNVGAAQLVMKWAAVMMETPEAANPLPPLTAEDRDILRHFLDTNPDTESNQ